MSVEESSSEPSDEDSEYVHENLSNLENTSLLKNLANQVISLLEENCQNNIENIWSDLKDYVDNEILSYCDQKNNKLNELRKKHADLIVAYENAPSISYKKSILSLVSNNFPKYTLMKAFKVSKNIVDYARNHAMKNGAGAFIEPVDSFRDKIDEKKVSIFLEFLTQGLYMQELAYGNKNFKISKGVSIAIPKVIRLANHARIYEDYLEYCKNSNLVPLSRTICFRIMSECSASFSKCMQGLDSMQADGLNAFDFLENILDSFKDIKKVKLLDCVLKANKNYLQFGLVKHLSFSSQCSDHCVTFALSSPDENSCHHTHVRDCSDCNMLDHLIIDIKKEIDLMPDSLTKKESIYQFNKASTRIYSWKNHIIRGWCQDQPKYEILKEIEMKGPLIDWIYIHGDWAMKFLPKWFRETQVKFFGKRGISWHITCVVFSIDHHLSCLCFIHIFDTCSQDVNAVIGIYESVLSETEKALGPKAIFPRNDNAGCYKNKSLITIMPFLAKKHGHTIEAYHFCEPQKGKDICDRKAGQVKTVINAYINNGNDVINASNLKKAIDKSKSISGVQSYICEMNDTLDFKDDFEFKNVASFHSIQYKDKSLVAYKHHNVGHGTEITYESLAKGELIKVNEKINRCKLTIIEGPCVVSSSNFKNSNMNLSLFKCEVCSFVVFSKNILDEHASSHTIKTNQYGKIKMQYSNILLDIKAKNRATSSSYKTDNLVGFSNLKENEKGFALKTPSKRGHFNDNQRSYLKEIFKKGKEILRITIKPLVNEEAILLS